MIYQRPAPKRKRIISKERATKNKQLLKKKLMILLKNQVQKNLYPKRRHQRPNPIRRTFSQIQMLKSQPRQKQICQKIQNLCPKTHKLNLTRLVHIIKHLKQQLCRITSWPPLSNQREQSSFPQVLRPAGAYL